MDSSGVCWSPCKKRAQRDEAVHPANQKAPGKSFGFANVSSGSPLDADLMVERADWSNALNDTRALCGWADLP